MPFSYSGTKNQQIRIGLTGGIASGKSTVAEFLKREGVEVMDMDALNRDIIEENPTVVKEISRIMGENVAKKGALDRQRIRELVFQHPHLKRDLENLMHPLIRREFEKRCDAKWEEGVKLVVCEAALLVECGYYKKLNGLIVVIAEEQMRISRLMNRDGSTRKLAEAIIRAQISDAERRKVATYTIENTGSRNELYTKTQPLLEEWREEKLID